MPSEAFEHAILERRQMNLAVFATRLPAHQVNLDAAELQQRQLLCAARAPAQRSPHARQ
jgi:hypothetical protein